MAFRGGNYQRAGEPPELIAQALKDAQHRSGLRVPPSSSNDSMYGATGEWTVNGESEVVKLPPFKFSIRNSHYGLDVTVREIDMPIFSAAGSLFAYASGYREAFRREAEAIVGGDNYNRMERGLNRITQYSQQWEAFKKDVEHIGNSFNVDTSDMQSDYFNSRFTLHVKVSPEIEAKSHAKSARIVDALEAAFPGTWAGLVARAADEEAQEAGHPADPDWSSTRERGELARAIQRATEAVSSGTLRIPFDASRRGWSKRRTRTGRGEYYSRQKKLKAGMLTGYVGEAGTPLGNTPADTIAPGDHEWMVQKSTGGRGGRYTSSEIIARGVAPDVESGIGEAERAMGISEGST